jgi:spore germination protein GerM
MAVRKTSTRKTATRKTTRKPPSKSASKGKRNRAPTSAAFWTFLIIVIIIAFFMLLPVIKRGLTVTPKTVETEQQQGTEKPQVEKPAVTEQKPTVSVQTPPPNTPVKEPEKKPQAEKPATPAQPSTPPVQPSPPPVKPTETRGSIYLIQESNKILVKVNRPLNANTPLTDSINALLAGPTPDEIMRGIESFVPEGSRLLSVKVEGTTAVLDFNQEFRYNTRGSEGCAAQIKQIVWTATEFPNVRDVQFLIEGEKVNFLSEGVVIRNPIGR